MQFCIENRKCVIFSVILFCESNGPFLQYMLTKGKVNFKAMKCSPVKKIPEKMEKKHLEKNMCSHYIYKLLYFDYTLCTHTLNKTKSHCGFVPNMLLSYTQFSGYLKELINPTPRVICKVCYIFTEYTSNVQPRHVLVVSRVNLRLNYEMRIPCSVILTEKKLKKMANKLGRFKENKGCVITLFLVPKATQSICFPLKINVKLAY